MMRIALISVTNHGAQLAQRLGAHYGERGEDLSVTYYEKEGKTSGHPEAHIFSSLKGEMEALMTGYDRLLFIMATGIVVRMIAPYIIHKAKDPAVLVMDEQAHFVISLLSGHLGGANDWCRELGDFYGATAVITTATDVNGLPAPDVLARDAKLTVADFSILKEVNAAIVNREAVPYWIDSSLYHCAEIIDLAVKRGISLHSFDGEAGPPPVTTEYAVVITDRVMPSLESAALATEGAETACTALDTEGAEGAEMARTAPARSGEESGASGGPKVLFLRPKTMVLGMGCRRDTEESLIRDAAFGALSQVGRAKESVLSLASVNVKADEKGLLAFAAHEEWPIHFFAPEEMAEQVEAAQLEESNFVKNTIGVGNVCETTALMLAQSQQLLLKKTIYPRTTVAVAQVHLRLSELDQVLKNS